MSLKEYRAKRDFTRSPEPRGDESTAPGRPKKEAPRFFCVQKHLASALHYDFRLEHNGVLLSWAVPKGPSLDSTVKRLAMQVEDHPIEYGTFEGVIPDGYAAGVVMLWDRGTWTPESEDVDAALAKGDLKLQLDGYKLKGSWVLVRTRGWGGGGGGRGGSSKAGGEESGRSWLLIKHRDDWAGPIDITTFAPLSVKSEGTFRDILTQSAPDLWQSHRAAPGKPTGDAALQKIVEKVIALEEDEAQAAPAPRHEPSAKTSAPTSARRKAARDEPGGEASPRKRTARSTRASAPAASSSESAPEEAPKRAPRNAAGSRAAGASASGPRKAASPRTSESPRAAKKR